MGRCRPRLSDVSGPMYRPNSGRARPPLADIGQGWAELGQTWGDFDRSWADIGPAWADLGHIRGGFDHTLGRCRPNGRISVTPWADGARVGQIRAAFAPRGGREPDRKAHSNTYDAMHMQMLVLEHVWLGHTTSVSEPFCPHRSVAERVSQALELLHTAQPASHLVERPHRFLRNAPHSAGQIWPKSGQAWPITPYSWYMWLKFGRSRPKESRHAPRS